MQDNLGDILRKTEVSFVPLSCILQTLWHAQQLDPTEILVSLSFKF